MRKSTVSNPRIMRLPTVLALIGLSKASVYRFMDAGTFPRPIKLGVRAVGWIATDAENWILEKTVQ